MSPLAEIAAKSGFVVSGSDQADSNESHRLRDLGIKVFNTHQSSNIEGARTVVYSSAIPPSNPELATARVALGVEVLHRSDFLAELMAGRSGVTIAGTHGKTTSSGMIALMLKELGLDPTAAVGGKILSENSYSMSGSGNVFVAEADESDGSFLKYRPYVGVLTNIARDHMDYFQDEAHIVATFRQYLKNIDPDGYAVIGWDNALSRSLGQDFAGNRLGYGFTLGSDVRGREFATTGHGISFRAMVERDAVEVFIPTLGKVNALNGLCALSVARALELDVRAAAEALGQFRGVGRRLNIVFSGARLRIVDDYAHNPDKIAGAIDATKDAWPNSRLIVCFQPHRYTRISSLFDQFVASFARADQVLVLPVYSAGEETIEGFEPNAIARSITKASGVEAHGVANFELCAERVSGFPGADLTVLTVGAGDIWRVGQMVKEACNG
jgi:UDP-N-acetylmuramate--alanine ligase